MEKINETKDLRGRHDLLSTKAMARLVPPYLEGLNAAQREAVEALDGPVLMLAGAGTGKTKALTARFIHLIKAGRAQPNEILGVTFTNKAAYEMKHRVTSLLGYNVDGLKWLGTFHSVCARFLRTHAELAGLHSNFTILDTDDQLRILKQLIIAERVDEKRWPARLLLGIIDSWKNRAFTTENLPRSENDIYDGKGPAFYSMYQARLKTLNACDFGDLLLNVVTILQQNRDILLHYQKVFKYILVDEYQDTNVAQYLLLRLLASGHRNICCVGDDDQSIYGWRGAEVGNILRFEKDFEDATLIRLEQNYRSTEHILAAATSVISANKNRLGKSLWTESKGGEFVRLIGHRDGEEEAGWIGEEIEAMQLGTRGQRKYGLNEIVVLVRASHQMRAFEDRFLKTGLPYMVIGGPRFYERLEIRDAIAYFRLLISLSDDLAFERVINTPKRGLGDKARSKIHIAARDNTTSLYGGAKELLRSRHLAGKAGIQLGIFIESLDRWRTKYADPSISHVEIAEMILDESGYTEMWQNDQSPDSLGRLENLKELIKALEEFENIEDFLEHIALVMENHGGSDLEKVSIMTLHASKGLEFPAVFLPGWEEGLFPSQRSMDENGLGGLEEERRLAYVGITRAKELCTISFAGNRRIYGQWQSALPSRFIDELPREHVEVLTPPGFHGHQTVEANRWTFNGDEENTEDIQDRAAKADVYASPGWKRLRGRVESKVLSPVFSKLSDGVSSLEPLGFEVGVRIFHRKFGYGTIATFEGGNADVVFDKAGEKKIKGPLGNYLVPADRADDISF